MFCYMLLGSVGIFVLCCDIVKYFIVMCKCLSVLYLFIFWLMINMFYLCMVMFSLLLFVKWIIGVVNIMFINIGNNYINSDGVK